MQNTLRMRKYDLACATQSCSRSMSNQPIVLDYINASISDYYLLLRCSMELKLLLPRQISSQCRILSYAQAPRQGFASCLSFHLGLRNPTNSMAMKALGVSNPNKFFGFQQSNGISSVCWLFHWFMYVQRHSSQENSSIVPDPLRHARNTSSFLLPHPPQLALSNPQNLKHSSVMCLWEAWGQHAPIFSKMKENWWKVGHAAIEMVTVFSFFY